MPEKRTVQRARRDLRQGKSASTAAGEFSPENRGQGPGSGPDQVLSIPSGGQTSSSGRRSALTPSFQATSAAAHMRTPART